MSELVNSDSGQTDRPLNLILIDDDLVFRTGLRVIIEQFLDLRVVAEVQSERDAREIIDNAQVSIDLVILDLDLGRLLPQAELGWDVCQQLKILYPRLPILLLSSVQQPVLWEAARQLGVEGFCLKGTNVSELIDAIRQVATGESYGYFNSTIGETPQLRTKEVGRSGEAGFFTAFVDRMRESGLRQIETALVEVTEELKDSRLSVLDRAILAGRRRELLAARRLVNRLLPPQVTATAFADQGTQSATPPPIPGGKQDSALVRREVSLPTGRSPILENSFAKIQYGLQNLTGAALEIDIFREEKKRELLNIVLRKLSDILDELRFSQVQMSQLAEKRSVILQDLWQSAATDFFGKYYTLQVKEQNLAVVDTIIQDAEIVQGEILQTIPLVEDLFSHLLFDTPLRIDNIFHSFGTFEAMTRAELLLQNLVIQVANAVVQPLLNNFADVEVIKQSFYDRRMITTRQIERFRNDLSWKYRLAKYVNEPTAIFESRYNLLAFDGYGIIKVSIYAPRGEELQELSGVQFALTLALETRDAIAPRLRSVVSLVGRSVVYVLTQVVGRAIGLIARGIIQGIGNSFDESKLGRKNGEKGK